MLLNPFCPVISWTVSFIDEPDMWQGVLYFNTNLIEVDVILSALLVLAFHQTRPDDCIHRSFPML